MAELDFGLEFGLIFGLVVALEYGLGPGLIFGLGLISSGAWLGYILTSCRLAAAGELPLRLMDFLDDSYRLGLLRTAGPAYQFRHAEFQDYLVRTGSSDKSGIQKRIARVTGRPEPPSP